MASQADIDRQLYDAARDGDINTIETLFAGSLIPKVDSVHGNMKETALRAASRNGSPEIAKYLISKGADVLATDVIGYTAAHELCYADRGQNASLELLQLLFEQDRSVISTKTDRGENCLHLAAECGKTDLVQWLLSEGVDATAKDDVDRTAWDLVAARLFKLTKKRNRELEDSLVLTYRAFLRLEMKYGDIGDILNGMLCKQVSDLEIYRPRASMIDIFVLLEYLMSQPPLQRACQNIRRELCKFTSTGNGWQYREPSCVFETQSLQHIETLDTALGGVCSKDTYESFKAMVAIEGNRPTKIDFEVSTPTHDQPEADSQRSAPNSVQEPPALLSKPQTNKVDHRTDTRERVSEYLSLVMPVIEITFKGSLDLDRQTCTYDLKYRSADRADSQLFCSSLTLDEYCYPALSQKILTRRNKDQTLSRRGWGFMDEEFLDMVIIVPVWMWLFEDVLIYTSQGPTADFEDSVRTIADSNRYAQVGQYLANLIDSSASDEILDKFQAYIVDLAEEVSSYIDQRGIESMTIEKEKKFYHNINDVREELSMIRRVLSQQEEVWRQFASNVWPDLWAECQTGRMRYPSDPQNADMEEQKALVRLIMRPRSRFQKSQQRISQLDEDAERVERSIAHQLDLKQKHASLQEAHATAVMSTAVFGFTIITIIFTPLSFLVSLFALPIDRFQDNQVPSRWASDAGMYSSNYIGTWVATGEIVSILLTFLAMWLALEYGLKYRVTLKAWNAMKDTNEKLYRAGQNLPIVSRIMHPHRHRSPPSESDRS